MRGFLRQRSLFRKSDHGSVARTELSASLARESSSRRGALSWTYADPLPESTVIAGMLSFDLGKAVVDAELPVGAVVGRAPATRGS